MMNQEQDIRSETAARMQVKDPAALRLEAILKGGSDRRFFRATWEKASCIVMAYGTEREENALFTAIGFFLEKLEIEVPRILAEDNGRRMVWVEDLGAADLWSFREASWMLRAPHYRSVLEQANLLHREGFQRAQKENLKLMPGFDHALYGWERDYFYDKFAGLACGLPLKQETRSSLEELFLPMTETLVKEKPTLIHRDFQSQNIMVKNGWTYLIDFQGMRQGTLYYDLASLLYDPYVTFTPEERLEMLNFYFVLPGSRPKRSVFDTLFRYAAIQRLMQALGAYGFLGIEKGKPDFLKHVEPALNNLELVVSELPELKQFNDLIRECRSCFQARVLKTNLVKQVHYQDTRDNVNGKSPRD